ncbi:MAG: hypothetical protein WDO14_21265 [Bacteroidota bacterium]
MRLSILFITIAALTLTALRAPETSTDNYTGYAYGEGTDKLLYTEEFTDRFIDGQHIETFTDYFDPQHNQIAKRVLDFRKSKFAPDFKTEDLRSGYMEGSETTGDKVRLFHRKNKNSKVDEKIMSIPEPMVVDGGFNQFIKANWSSLEKGETITFHFVIPARLDYFTLRAVMVESNEKEMKVRVEPDKTLIRLLASPIDVRYSKDTRRILTYEGQSNISDENGNNFVMRLVYPKKGP